MHSMQTISYILAKLLRVYSVLGSDSWLFTVDLTLICLGESTHVFGFRARKHQGSNDIYNKNYLPNSSMFVEDPLCSRCCIRFWRRYWKWIKPWSLTSRNYEFGAVLSVIMSLFSKFHSFARQLQGSCHIPVLPIILFFCNILSGVSLAAQW